MLLRARWFTIGFMTAAGLGAYIVDRVRKARRRLTPRAAARASVVGIADVLEAASRRVAPPPAG